jgi:hypothetical protein
VSGEANGRDRQCLTNEARKIWKILDRRRMVETRDRCTSRREAQMLEEQKSVGEGYVRPREVSRLRNPPFAGRNGTSPSTFADPACSVVLVNPAMGLRTCPLLFRTSRSRAEAEGKRGRGADEQRDRGAFTCI